MPSLDQNTISALKLDNAHIWGFYTLVVAVFVIGIGLVIGSKKKAAQCLPFFDSDGIVRFEKTYNKDPNSSDSTMMPFFFPMFWNSTSTQIMQVDESDKQDNALYNLMVKVRDMKYGGHIQQSAGTDVGGFSRFMGIYAYSLLSITSSTFGAVYQAVHTVHNMSDGLVLEVFVFLFATVAFGLASVLIPLIMFFMTLYNTIYINVLLNNSVVQDKLTQVSHANGGDIKHEDYVAIASSLYTLNAAGDAITGIQCKQNFINYVSGYFLNVLNNDWTYILNTPKYNEWIDKERKTLWGALVWFYWGICGIFTLILYAFIYFIVFLSAIVYIVVVIMIAFFAAHIMSAVIAPPFVLFYAVYVCFMTVHFKRLKPKHGQNVIDLKDNKMFETVEVHSSSIFADYLSKYHKPTFIVASLIAFCLSAGSLFQNVSKNSYTYVFISCLIVAAASFKLWFYKKSEDDYFFDYANPNMQSEDIAMLKNLLFSSSNKKTFNDRLNIEMHNKNLKLNSFVVPKDPNKKEDEEKEKKENELAKKKALIASTKDGQVRKLKELLHAVDALDELNATLASLQKKTKEMKDHLPDPKSIEAYTKANIQLKATMLQMEAAQAEHKKLLATKNSLHQQYNVLLTKSQQIDAEKPQTAKLDSASSGAPSAPPSASEEKSDDPVAIPTTGPEETQQAPSKASEEKSSAS